MEDNNKNTCLCKSTKVVVALIFSVALIACAIILGSKFKNRYAFQDTISVTGLGEQQFVSDLIVWEASFQTENMNLQNAYKELDQNREDIQKFLNENGVSQNDVVFGFVNIARQTEPIYSGNGNYAGSRFSGYSLYQSFKIESTEVEKIEKVSRDMSQLIVKGIQLNSLMPEYYYTKLADLKLELIAAATKDARERALKIAGESNASLSNLKVGKMGVFQITGANSNEEYKWGGSYNSSSKHKKASITMRLEYHLK